MTINHRIKVLRNHLGLSQPKFGEKIGVSRDVIANIELERVVPKEMLLNHICSVFKVNHLWLNNGNGEMFIEVEDNIIENLAEIYELNQLETSIIKKFVSLNKTDRKVILDFICSLNHEEKDELINYSKDLVDSGNYSNTVTVVEAARSKNNDKPIKVVQTTVDDLKIFDIAPQSDEKL